VNEITSDRKYEALAAWLVDKLPATGVRVTALTLAGTGNSAQTFFAKASCVQDGTPTELELVIRRQNQGSDFFLDADLDLPYQMMRVVAECSDVPVPRMVGIERDGAVLGAPFLVMHKCEGHVAHQVPNYNVQGWLKDLPTDQRGTVWRNGLHVLARIHQLDWTQGFNFLNQPARGAPGLDQYLHMVTDWYRWARGDREHPVSDAAIDFLMRECPTEAPVAVLWGDPTPANIVFRDDLMVSAVIDWEMAALGPPEVDVAWWLFFDDLFSLGMGVPRLAGLPDRATAIAWYETYAGTKLADLHWYDVLAALRMTIIGMRAADRQIGLGRIPESSTARTHSPFMRMLAAKLGEPQPEVGQDFIDLMGAMGMDEPGPA
jgi:aminoglycoside phosphotransferase (APT) family kinase protein